MAQVLIEDGCRCSSEVLFLIPGATTLALHVPSSSQDRKRLPFCFTTTNFGFYHSKHDCYHWYSYHCLLLSLSLLFLIVVIIIIIIIIIITIIIIIIITVIIIVVLPQLTRRSRLQDVYNSVSLFPLPPALMNR